MICTKGEQRDASVPRLPPPAGGTAHGPLRYYRCAKRPAAAWQLSLLGFTGLL